MEISKYLTIGLISALVGCGGGGGNNHTTRFDGRYVGVLTGESCLDGNPIQKQIAHDVDADSEELGSPVELTDQDGRTYSGAVEIETSRFTNFFGFVVTPVDLPEAGKPSRIIYEVSEADDTLTFVTEFLMDPSGCESLIRAELPKS